jgi:hypothetical protein
MEVFGTDVDECDNPCIDAAGADVTGLASGQKLTLNLTKAWSSDDEEDLAMALMYDQYSVVTPGDGSHPYLRGIPGIFHQGKFRVHDPCDVGDFYVEVYEKNGKVRQKLDNGSYTEMVSCVAPQVPEATELTITVATASIMEDANGVVTGTVTVSGWEAVLGAVSYHVGAFDMSTPGQPTIAGYEEVPSIQPVEFEGIRSGIEYIYAVVGELADGTYSRLRYHSQANTFTLGQ